MKTNLLLGAVFAGALLAAPAAAQESTTWNWKGTLGNGRTVYLRNVNGAVRFEQGSGNTVEVRAEKRWRRGDPDDVRIEARQGANGGDIIICAFWHERATCDEDGYHSNNNNNNRWNDRNDVSVHFVVRIPANARVVAGTVNGEMVVDGTSGDVEASTVNGDVEARSTQGRVEATTVNGSITVRTSMTNSEDLKYSTVNGSITIEMAEGANADVDLTTVNGRVSSDFPLTIDGRINPRKIRAKLGTGGARLRASTVNGSIRLRKL